MKDMEKLVNKLNEAAKNYYSESEITKMSDHEYDRLYDELVAMEKETGVVLPDSPTLRVGYAVVHISTLHYLWIRRKIRRYWSNGQMKKKPSLAGKKMDLRWWLHT